MFNESISAACQKIATNKVSLDVPNFYHRLISVQLRAKTIEIKQAYGRSNYNIEVFAMPLAFEESRSLRCSIKFDYMSQNYQNFQRYQIVRLGGYFLEGNWRKP